MIFYSFYSMSFILLLFSPLHFILFDASVNGIIFLITFLKCSLQMHRGATDFCIFCFYPSTLMKLFINSNLFGWIL